MYDESNQTYHSDMNLLVGTTTMNDELTYQRKAMGRYTVLHDGIRVGEVRTTRYHKHWCWIVVAGCEGDDWRHRHFSSREQAAAAAANLVAN